MSEQAAEKPGIFKRMYIGATNFVTHAVGYIPRGILYTTGIFAGSAILESTMGISGLGIAKATNGALLADGLLHVGLGSMLSGVIGGGLAAYNAGKGQGEQVQAPAMANVIKPSKGELDVAENLVGQVHEAAVTHASGLPANLKTMTKTFGIG